MYHYFKGWEDGNISSWYKVAVSWAMNLHVKYNYHFTSSQLLRRVRKKISGFEQGNDQSFQLDLQIDMIPAWPDLQYSPSVAKIAKFLYQNLIIS